MIRLITYLLLSLALAAALAMVFSTDGSVLITIGDTTLQPTLGTAAITLLIVFMLTLFVVWLIRRIVRAPAAIAAATQRNAQKKALLALGDSFIALEAGDAAKARSLARDAGQRLPDPVAAKLLEARANLKLEDWSAAKDTYKDLLEDPRTAIAALSGLYDQALAQNRPDAALTFAQKAHAQAPALAWASDALFANFTAQQDWEAAREQVTKQNPRSKAQKDIKSRKLVVLNSALAAQEENDDPTSALANALAALKLDPNFIPAALIAARIMSSRNEVRKATSLLRRVWRQNPHPHLAMLYAHAQPGISAAQRLNKIFELLPNPPQDQASAIVVAQIAIDAQDWVTARNALAGYSGSNPTKDICLAMAEIEEGQNHDHGRAREWLAKAISASADPAWTADGQTFDEWQPVSPASGSFDAVEWKVPIIRPTLPETEEPDALAAETPPAKLDGNSASDQMVEDQSAKNSPQTEIEAAHPAAHAKPVN